MDNPALPCRFEADANSTTDVKLICGCVDVSSENGLPAEKAYYTSAVSNEVTCTTDTPIIALRQPNSINGQHNTRDIRLLRITVTSDKKAVVTFWTTRNSSAVVGGSFVRVNGGIGSYIEENLTATSVVTANMHRVTSIPIQAGLTREVTNPEPQIVDFILVHGDYIVLTGTGASANIQAVVEWGEEV
jgi:hypothetical protein